MKAITIKQPWATLIALGEKRFETRSWPTAYRGKLAIHAGQTIDKPACSRQPVAGILAKHGLTPDTLPRGAVIALCELADCLRVVSDLGGQALLATPGAAASGNEYAFGDYAEGRYAWALHDVRPIEPIAAKGKLSLWDFAAEHKE